MRLQISNVRHPRTGKVCTVYQCEDGTWATPDGVKVNPAELRLFWENYLGLWAVGCLAVLAIVLMIMYLT